MQPMVGGVQEELTVGPQEQPISQAVARPETEPEPAANTRRPRRKSPQRRSGEGVTVLPLWDD